MLSIHNLIVRCINPKEAGRYRRVPVLFSGNTFTPPQPLHVPKEMESLFNWYEFNRNNLHPVVLADEMHEKFFSIQPFID